MRDPVVAADGHTYERAGAERWFARHGAVSMVTGAALPHTHLVPNQASYHPPHGSLLPVLLPASPSSRSVFPRHFAATLFLSIHRRLPSDRTVL